MATVLQAALQRAKCNTTQKELEILRIKNTKVFFSLHARRAFQLVQKLGNCVIWVINQNGLIKKFSVIIWLPPPENDQEKYHNIFLILSQR